MHKSYVFGDLGQMRDRRSNNEESGMPFVSPEAHALRAEFSSIDLRNCLSTDTVSTF